MKDMLITKEEIIAATAELIRSTYCSLYSPSERRMLGKAFHALSENTPEGSQLSELFRVCALSIPIYRNCSLYENKLLDLEQNLKKAGLI
jgi:hypothetical protein